MLRLFVLILLASMVAPPQAGRGVEAPEETVSFLPLVGGSGRHVALPGWPQESCPAYSRLWMTRYSPGNPETIAVALTGSTAWCARLWADEILVIIGSGWCSSAGCDAVCRDGYCVAGLNPMAGQITVWWDAGAHPVEVLEIYTVDGRPTPVRWPESPSTP